MCVSVRGSQTEHFVLFLPSSSQSGTFIAAAAAAADDSSISDHLKQQKEEGEAKTMWILSLQ